MSRLLAALVFAALAPGAAHAGDGPWEPSKLGKVECVVPDFENKTCQSMAIYTWGEDGKVVARDRGIDPYLLPGVVMTIEMEQHINGDKNCVVLSEAPYRSATFEYNGQPSTAAKTEEFRTYLIGRLSPYFGSTFCADISPYANEYIVQVSINGVPKPTATTRLAWIDPDSGFTLAP